MSTRFIKYILGITERTYERHSLLSVIKNDLLRFGKLPLFLFVFTVATAIAVITISYHTRLLIIQQEQLMLEREALDIEWRNLILEKNVLNNNRRINRITAIKKLQL